MLPHMDECPLPPSYLDYFLAICANMEAGGRPHVGNATPETLEAAINWWYAHPSLLAAMSIEDALTWLHSGQLMPLPHFRQVMDGREVTMPYPCTIDLLLFAMRLASCMEERELMAEILGGMIVELEAKGKDKDKPQP